MVKRIVIYILFLVLVVYTGYLYSLRFELVPWGSARRDGLFFLVFYFCILPALVIISGIKRYVYKTYNSFLKNSFFLYSILITIPAIDTYARQLSLAFSFFISCTIVIMLLYELFVLRALMAQD